ncbi:MAG: hypothetical protein V9H69_05490 [Anaerolineae bacterium]
MKQTHLVRLFSWLVIIAVVVTMAPPALSSGDYANQGERITAALPELTQAADAVRLTASDSLHATMLGAREDLPVLASAAISTTLPVVEEAPALDAPLAEDAIWAGDSFTGTQTAAPEAAPVAPEGMFGFKPPLSLELLLDVQPNRAKPGEVLSYRLIASHTGYDPLTDITIDIPTPRGLVYVAGSAVGFSYEPSAKLLTWQIAALQPGEALTGGFQLRATGLAVGELATVQASAASPLADGVSLGSAVAEITPPAADRVRVTPGEGGWLRSTDGRVEVKAPAGAVAVPLLFSYRPAEGALPPGPRFAFQLNAEGEGGNPVERFQQPVTLVYPYRQAGVAERGGEGHGLLPPGRGGRGVAHRCHGHRPGARGVAGAERAFWRLCRGCNSRPWLAGSEDRRGRNNRSDQLAELRVRPGIAHPRRTAAALQRLHRLHLRLRPTAGAGGSDAVAGAAILQRAAPAGDRPFQPRGARLGSAGRELSDEGGPQQPGQQQGDHGVEWSVLHHRHQPLV